MGAPILLVEDDEKIGRGVSQVLANNGYDVDWATSGEEAIARASARPPTLILVDLDLPDIDGIELCARFRSEHPEITIVILSARVDEIDVVVGLDAGADDYVTKPFRLEELLARVRAHLRRVRLDVDDVLNLTVGGLTIDRAARRVQFRGRELDLRRKEFDLLTLLAVNAGRALPRETIMSEVWDAHWLGSTKTLDMHISALRRKLAAPTRTSPITTVPGGGYRLERE